jgi:hypothetical protein
MTHNCAPRNSQGRIEDLDLTVFDLTIFDLTIFDLIIFDLIMLVALGSPSS